MNFIMLNYLIVRLYCASYVLRFIDKTYTLYSFILECNFKVYKIITLFISPTSLEQGNNELTHGN